VLSIVEQVSFVPLLRDLIFICVLSPLGPAISRHLILSIQRAREFRTTTLRDLYTYVLSAITHKPNFDATNNAQPSTRMLMDSFAVRSPHSTGITEESAASTRFSPPPMLPPPPAPPRSQSLSSSRRVRSTSVGSYSVGGGGPDKPPVYQRNVSTGRSVYGDINQSPNSEIDRSNQQEQIPTSVPYRERLGGYLHPRDMRRLVTPFSATNEPVLMVRRHVMLLNFDPLRAIVLRDRLLLLVPDGADAILIHLEKRLRGGLEELENEVFGDVLIDSTYASQLVDDSEREAFNIYANKPALDACEIQEDNNTQKDTLAGRNMTTPEGEPLEETDFQSSNPGMGSQPPEDALPAEEDEFEFEEENFDEWEDIDQRKFMDVPFELLAVDVVLESVVHILLVETGQLCERVESVIRTVSMEGKAPRQSGHNNYEKLRVLKDKVKEIESRVKGFERALTQVLDEDEDMALMNLSRLLTHPERFVRPVSQDILNEESDEPELILEAYLQQAFSASNSLELLNGKIETTEELVEMKLDTIRNRLLFVNTVLTLIMLFVAVGSMVGSIFGMNLINGLESSPVAFKQVVIGSLTCIFVLFTLVCLVFWKHSTWLLHS